jgi:hypothetical protein
MKFQHRLLTAAAVAAVAVFTPRSLALVSLQDGEDHVFVDGTVNMSYDSNVFTNSRDQGSVEYAGTVSMDFTRRAGWIGVNVTASLDWTRFTSYSSQDYVDPKISAELTKQTGRTTGSLTMSAQREDRADVDVNTRDVSWNYDVGLNFHYPVIERYSISGALDYTRADYQDQVLFTNQTTYSGSLYLYYILNDRRDLFVDYHQAYTDEAKDAVSDVDRSLSTGVSGKVIGPFDGSLSVGYEERTPTGGPVALRVGEDDFTASGKTIWNISRRMSLAADLSRDLSTTAEAVSIETTEAELTLQDSFTTKASLSLDASGGQNRFLGVQGLNPDGSRRVDTFVSLGASYFYTLNQHLKASVNYTYYRNWSTLAYAEFPREQLSLSLTSHW